MPIVRQRGTSVKERIAAIEKSTPPSTFHENTIIRAKYAPDVRGVNRYRHFHMPNITNDVNCNYGKDSSSCHNTIASTTHLPFLIRPGQTHYFDPDDRDAANGMEKVVRRKKRNVTLPHLPTAGQSTCKRDRDIIDKIEEQAKIAMEKASSESDNSLKSNHSGVRLNDHISNKKKSTSNGSTRRTFASLGQRQNGVIINRPANNSLEVALPPRSKSAQDIEARMEPDYSPPDNTFYDILAAPSLKGDFRDMATQTTKNITTASVEYLNCGRGTQTDSVPMIIVPRRKSEAPVNIRELEEREALMQVIEDAFSETFDRYTRVRTNQIIANSAKKQAQILRDAKDFLANSLIPHAVVMANKSQSKPKTAAEIVANIKIFP